MQAPQRSLCQEDRSPATRRLLALEPHWLGFLLVASSLSPHLARFLARPVGRPRFRFVGSWIVGLAMGGAESRGAGADSFHLVLVVARLKLWLILMACLRHLVSALTNTDDILKIAFADLLSGSQGSPTVPSPQLFQT